MGLLVGSGALMAVAIGGLLWVLFGGMMGGNGSGSATTGGASGGTGMASTGSTGTASSTPLAGKDLEKILAGATIQMRRPLKPVLGSGDGDGEFILKLARGGRLKGEAYSVTGNTADTARWSVSRDRLCIDWAKWTSGKRHCYRIARTATGYTATGGKGVLAGAFNLIR